MIGVAIMKVIRMLDLCVFQPHHLILKWIGLLCLVLLRKHQISLFDILSKNMCDYRNEPSNEQKLLISAS